MVNCRRCVFCHKTKYLSKKSKRCYRIVHKCLLGPPQFIGEKRMKESYNRKLFPNAWTDPWNWKFPIVDGDYGGCYSGKTLHQFIKSGGKISELLNTSFI